MNEYLRAAGEQHVLVLERRFAHPPAKVWRALTEGEHIGQWFPASMEMELAVGAKITFRFGPDDEPSFGEITDLDSPRLFAFSWETEHLRWELEPDGDGCKLRLTQTFQDRPAAASYAAGWHGCFQFLEVVLDGGKPFGEQGSSVDHTVPYQMKVEHEKWIAKLGLDSGVVEDGTVRYEWQLVKGPLEVWEALSGGAAVEVGGAVPPGFVPDGVAVGPIVVAEPPAVLATSQVRWTLREGNGGARLVVTHEGADEAALSRWRDHVEAFAASLV